MVEAITAQMDALAVDKPRAPYSEMERRWIERSIAVYEAEQERADKPPPVVLGVNPKNDDDFKRICERLFGKGLAEFLRARDPGRRKRVYEEEIDSFQGTFNWLQRCEKYMLMGERHVYWIDPHLDTSLQPRKFTTVVPVGVGNESAVILGERNGVWSLYVAPLSYEAPAFFANCSTKRALADMDLENIAKKNIVSFESTSCGALEAQPQRAAVHGMRVSCFWAAKKRRTTDLLRIYTLPNLSNSPGGCVELEFPPDVCMRYELHWPYLVFVASSQRLFSIQWFAALESSAPFRSISELETISDFVVVVNLETRVVQRAIQLPAPLEHLALYPTQNCVADLYVPLDEVRILMVLDDSGNTDKNAKFNKITVVDRLINKASDSFFEAAFTMWKPPQVELAERGKGGVAYKSAPDEPTVLLRRSHNGHVIQISPHNMSTLISGTELFTESEIYFARDSTFVDAAIYANTYVKLQPNHVVAFGCIRAQDPKDALRPVTTFKINDLKEHYQEDRDAQHPVITSVSALPRYKAIWVSLERIAVLLTDGTLLFFCVFSKPDRDRLHQMLHEARTRTETRQKVKQFVEEKTKATMAAEGASFQNAK